MQFRQVLKVAKRWWWLGLMPVVVVLVYVLATYHTPATVYQVVLRFTAGGTPTTELSADYDRYYAWLSSEYVANGLADLAVTGAFAQDVAQRLAEDGMTVAPGAIQGAIVTDNAQSVMVVYLTWPDAQQAGAIAAAVGEALIELGPSYYPQMEGLGSVAKLADPPAPVALAPSLRTQLLGPVIRELLGAALGAGLIVVAHMLDPYVRDAEDVAGCGVTVLSSLPSGTPRRKARAREVPAAQQ